MWISSKTSRDVLFFSVAVTLVAAEFYPSGGHQPEPDPADARKSARFFRLTPFIIMLGVIAFGCMSCEGTMYDWSVVYFKEVIGADRDLSRMGYIAYMSAMATGRFLGDSMITKFGVIRVLQSSGILVFCGMILAVALPGWRFHR